MVASSNRRINECAIYIENANKSYGRNKILNDFCMTVPRGQIYALLGASGAGKTTVLSCVLGLNKLNSGEIFVLGGKPGTPECGIPGPRVGYMPQDIALALEFTVKDAIFYFGRILNMSDNLINERFDNLKQLLDLPPDNRRIKNCSGGQQRRISFAVALIHQPELLILDEPTVGLDPVLRASIWDYLLKIAEEEHIAVVLTTHYIEEARKAHKIGFIRGGKLLVEQPPDKLLQTFNTEKLEDVFFILSKRQEEDRLNGDVVGQENVLETDGPRTVDLLASVKSDNGRKIHQSTVGMFAVNHRHLKSLLIKNFKQLIRGSGNGLVVGFILPIIEILCFIFAIGNDPKNLPIAVINIENTNNCIDYHKSATATPYFISNCKFANLSCRFMDAVQDPSFSFVNYDNLEYARNDVEKGKLQAVIYIAHNFSDAFSNRVNHHADVSDVDLEFGQVQVWLDAASQLHAGVRVRLFQLFQRFLVSTFHDCNYFEKLGTLPLRFHFEYGTVNEAYVNFLIPGALMTIVFFLGTILSCSALVNDRIEGIWDRSIVAGVSSMEIYISHFCTQLLLVLMQSLQVVVLAFQICWVEYSGNIWLIFLLVLTQGISGMSFGFFTSILTKDHYAASSFITGIFLPMVCLGGLVWPVEAQPDGLRHFSLSLPFTIPNYSLRQVIKKGYGLGNLQVLSGLGVTLLWIAILIILAVIVIKMKR